MVAIVRVSRCSGARPMRSSTALAISIAARPAVRMTASANSTGVETVTGPKSRRFTATVSTAALSRKIRQNRDIAVLLPRRPSLLCRVCPHFYSRKRAIAKLPACPASPGVSIGGGTHTTGGGALAVGTDSPAGHVRPTLGTMDDRLRRRTGWLLMAAGLAAIATGIAAGHGLPLAAGLVLAAVAAHLIAPADRRSP
ncbi:hypothetical protein Psuf_090820 [Phytohabitans suffuscus]|uniref:Uncharacterized protein n=2 Tax=Phytohabitans suffuscus TaxID=624315 RepID=A0A6F8Z0C1_9ACTN|nr:hypothetical protein Psuf_090820 [Phytohabitans suffuscus]